MALNLDPLNRSGYLRTQQSEPARGYYRYHLNNSSKEAIETAQHAIKELTLQNSHLILLSSDKELSKTIEKNPYLIIHGNIVCFSQKEPADPYFLSHKTCFLTGEVLEEPVSCELGHVFERCHILAWAEQKESECPISHERNHRIISTEINQNILRDVQKARDAFREAETVLRESGGVLEKLRATHEEHQRTIESLRKDLAAANQRNEEMARALRKSRDLLSKYRHVIEVEQKSLRASIEHRLNDPFHSLSVSDFEEEIEEISE